MRTTALALLVVAGCAGAPVRADLPAATRYLTHEVEFRRPSSGYANPWEGVSLHVVFRAPSGRTLLVGGFYGGPDRWLARVAPDEPGRWTWRATFEDAAGRVESEGRFDCVDRGEPGFVRVNPANRFRMVFSDGSAFQAIGLEDCFLDVDRDGDPFDDLGLDGGFRSDCPPGDERCRDEGWTTDLDTYLSTYGARGAGFNLFRVTVDNCSFRPWERIDFPANLYLVR